jgi:transportin-1
MSFSNPLLIAKHLDSFVKQFCLSIRFADDSREKQEAFMGLCRSIIANPQGLINHLPYFCDAISQYENPPDELDRMFNELINSYKTSLSNRWNDIFQNFPEKLQKKLIYRFNIS